MRQKRPERFVLSGCKGNLKSPTEEIRQRHGREGTADSHTEICGRLGKKRLARGVIAKRLFNETWEEEGF